MTSTSKEMENRYWLLLEKSDETRISKGIDGYQDKTGESYNYDNLVPNHKQLSSGDFVVIRKENEILGVGRVGKISQYADTKIHRRCPACRSTDTRERITKNPKWKCGKCAHQFEEPEESIVEVESFTATIEDFARLNSPPLVPDVKRCANQGDGIASQLSILELDPAKIQTLIEALAPSLSSRTEAPRKIGQGFGLSQVERKQVELRAMRVARELYERQGWTLVDTSSSYPFDLYATRQGEQRFIEVKGTTGEGLSIMLTNGEVRHVKQHKRFCALVIVSGIELNECDGSWIALGGHVTTHEDPWLLDESGLEATEYRYSIQQKTHNRTPE